MWKKPLIICCIVISLPIVAIMAWNHFVTSVENRAYKKFYNTTLRNEASEKKRDSLQVLVKERNSKYEILTILSEPLTKDNKVVQYKAMLAYIKMRKDDPDVNKEKWEKREKGVTEALAIYKKNME